MDEMTNGCNGFGTPEQQQFQQQLQEAIMEACFWKTKYFELHTHSSQVIAMLSRPQVTAEQLNELVAAAQAAQGQKTAQEPSQPQEQPYPEQMGA